VRTRPRRPELNPERNQSSFDLYPYKVVVYYVKVLRHDKSLFCKVIKMGQFGIFVFLPCTWNTFFENLNVLIGAQFIIYTKREGRERKARRVYYKIIKADWSPGIFVSLIKPLCPIKFYFN